MVIDVAKGVEERTIKLMEVCRLRDTPIMTFINKLDREGKEPIDLLDEVESVLGIQCAPVTADRHGAAPEGRGPPDQRRSAPVRTGPQLHPAGFNHFPVDRFAGPAEKIGEGMLAELRDELELVQGASHAFDLEAYRRQADAGVLRFGREQLRRAAAAGLLR